MASPREMVGVLAPEAATSAAAVVGKAILFGVAGWAAENLLYGPRYSAMWQGHHVPFLPVYALGGVTVLAAAPHISSFPIVGRAAIYAAILGGLEFAGCQIDRKILNGRSWDYGERDGLAARADGCVDWRHSALWGGLGLLAEQVAP